MNEAIRTSDKLSRFDYRPLVIPVFVLPMSSVRTANDPGPGHTRGCEQAGGKTVAPFIAVAPTPPHVRRNQGAIVGSGREAVGEGFRLRSVCLRKFSG